jgi:hypothetical protein
LPKAFSRLKPYEIEDCLCIYKNALRNTKHGLWRRHASVCSPRPTHSRPYC